MTAPAVTAPAVTATGPTVRSVTRRARGPVLTVVALLVVGVLVALATPRGSGGRLDPASYSPDGARAVAEVLRDLDVPVSRVTSVADAVDRATPRTVVVIPVPSALVESELRTLGGVDAALVVVGAQDEELQALDLPAEVADLVDVQNRRPACELPAATAAGSAEIGGLTYRPTGDASSVGCYAVDGASSLLQLTERDATLLGIGTLLTNDKVGRQGNAALVLRLLGADRDGVLWLIPDPNREIAPSERGSLSDLLPDGLFLGLAQLGVAVVVLALWRARRLGRVVEEPLPVVVRAAEAVEGRGRLYQVAEARDQAAEALRAATRDRAARRAGVGPAAARTSLVPVVAARSGTDAAEVDALLYGGAPADDRALVRLADDLRALEARLAAP